MGLQLTTPVSTARTILNDAAADRYSAADLLLYANDALDLLVTLVPELFYTDGTHACTAGTVDQTLSFASALRLVNVNKIQGGNVVTQADLSALDEFDPAWRSATAAAAVNWQPKNGHPLKFMIYPKAPANQALEVTYVAVPSEYALTDDTGLPASLADAVADYIVYRAETRDDEHVNSNRAIQFLATFTQKVGGTPAATKG